MSDAEGQPWRARIRSPDGRVYGAGFVVAQQQVVTCAHVVADALGLSSSGPPPDPERRVLVDFPAAGVTEPVGAVADPNGWNPIGADGRGDVAVLYLQAASPVAVKPAPLRRPSRLAGHRISTFGYPRKIDDGEWAHGTVSGPGGPGGQWVQLDATTVTGARIGHGFSGAAVYDHTIDGVIGMVVAEDKDPEAKIAWMLPFSVLADAWPPLAGLLPTRLRLDPAFRGHWQPRGRGVERHVRPGWYFTGRAQVLRQLVGWLHGPAGSDPKARVITGGPGSGKSAVLARLVTLADRTYRAEIPAEVLVKAAPGTVPKLGSVDVAVHAAGKTLAEIVTAIAEASGTTADSPDALVDDLLDRGRPLTIVLDALDEATQPEQLARMLLQPLALDGGRVGIRLLIGTRRHMVGLLQAGAVVLDLDDSTYHDRKDLVDYVHRILVADGLPAATTPYQEQPELADMVAEALVARADPSFLVAQLAARDLADRPEPVDISRAGWKAQFPDTVPAAMDGYLARYGPDKQRITDLLLPLAWAQGGGLSDDQVWAELATALGTAAYRDYDVRLVRDTAIGTLLQPTPTNDGPAYRLFHEALAEHLRSKRPERDAHRAFTRVLLAHTPRRPNREQPDWAAASSYTQAHFVIHAAHAGQLDEHIADPAFVLHVDPDRLLGVLRHVTTPAGRTTADTIEGASHHLRAGPLPERAAYLQLVARQRRDTVLAEALDHSGLLLKWRTPWAFWRTQGPHRVIGHHPGRLGVRVVVATLSDGHAIAITASDGTIRLWDLETGTPRTDPIPAHQAGDQFGGWVEQLAVATLPGGQPVAITAGGDGTIRLWDLETGTPRTDPLAAHDGGDSYGGGVQQLAVATSSDGQPIAITTGGEGTIRLWDLGTGTPRSDPIRAYQTGLVGRTIGQLAVAILPGGHPIAITTGGRDGTIRLWDLETGTPRTDPIPAHDGWVEQLAVATLPGGHPIAITAGGDRVCTLDLGAGCIWRQISVGSQIGVVAPVPNGLLVVAAQMGLVALWGALPGESGNEATWKNA